ncbi:DUF4199 domain-containing protein [Lutibacter sp.]|uniref:DUF4199 domain-containing protein n=1 Tax=Lutibacter sp. TaxID=1925666 RepID=UPI00273611A1|nr:DUF4199 domain-containing protein [Lutibacter sp.]MDP3312524.1 DUF4199 domain-containing protein [Lutibacter sp.]
MENQTNTSKQVMINYGLMLGFASILFHVVLYAMGKIYDPHWSVAIIGITLSIVFIVLGIKLVKETNEGILSLGEAIKIGLGISLISAIVYIIYLAVFTSFIEPEYFTRMAEVQHQKMLENYPQMSDEQLDAANAMTEKMSGLGMTVAFTLIGSLFIGFIISLIAGLIMKKTVEDNE